MSELQIFCSSLMLYIRVCEFDRCSPAWFSLLREEEESNSTGIYRIHIKVVRNPCPDVYFTIISSVNIQPPNSFPACA